VTGKLASVDLRRGEYLVSTYSKTIPGFWILDGTPTRLPQESSPSQLGEAIRAALDKSRQGVEGPGIEGKPGQPLLDLLGLPDYSTYAKGTRSVEVYLDSDREETVEVTPNRNEGGNQGFTPIEEELRTFTYESPAHLGTEVIKAFEKAT
jgi:hypothetical protein